MRQDKDYRIPDNEIKHGRKLSQQDPEVVWGWGSPAGRVRARRRAALIAEGAYLRSGVRALEIGCGTGLFTEFFVQTGAHITAVDISPDLLRQARERNLPQDGVRFVEKPFEDCEVDGPFDAVIGSSILHHLDLGASLAKIFALLKPGGIMSFAEPNMLNPQIVVQKNISWIKNRLGDSPDETAFVRFSLIRQLQAVGFKHITVTPFDWLHPKTPEILIRMVSTVGRLFEVIPLIRELSGSLYLRCEKPLV